MFKIPSFLTFVFLLLCAGCQTLTYKQMQAKNPIAKNSAKSPVKMVDVWSSYAQTTPDGKALRGIAGRIHFYNDSKKKKSVKVDGDVTVFVFDAEQTDPAHSKPLRVYQFRSETLDKHYVFKKPLGHGYDFFLPFDELGGEEKRLCVMTRFDDGLEDNLVLTQPVNTILEGKKREMPENPVQQFLTEHNILKKANEELMEREKAKSIRQVNYEKEKEEPVRNITTIPLNENWSKPLQKQGGQTPESENEPE